MLTRFASLATLALLLISPSLVAQRPLAVTLESVGMSAPRLARLSQVLEEYTRTRQVAGTVTLVARSGLVVYHEAARFRDLEQRAPMQRDTVFRIASQTKALTSVAIMQLVEGGKLLPTDPVSKFLPSFEKTTVRAAMDAAPVSARRRITIRDLLTHTAGVSYGGEARSRISPRRPDSRRGTSPIVRSRSATGSTDWQPSLLRHSQESASSMAIRPTSWGRSSRRSPGCRAINS